MKASIYMRVNSREQLDGGIEGKMQMERVDLVQEKMEEAEIKGRLVLFTGLRLGKNSIPEGMYIYALRHGDDAGIPCFIEKNVTVHYFGTVVTAEPFDFGDKEYIPVKCDDFGFTGEYLSIVEFAEKINRIKTEETQEDHGAHHMQVQNFEQEGQNLSLPIKERER